MDKNRYSCIAHGQLPIWNPIGVSHLQAYVSQLSLPEDSAVLDIGCGRGHVLDLVLSQYQARGIGVDSSPYAIALAAKDLAHHVAASRLNLFERAFDAREFDAASFNLVICLGSTHVLGGYRDSLRMAKRLLSASSLLLVGEGYWKCPPAGEYLAFLKMAADEQSTHDGNQAQGIDECFELVACSECSKQEWDGYEDQYARNVENYVQANRADPEAEAMWQRIQAWREGYLRWGRETLGFGLYLFRLRGRGSQLA
jgi:cyclopropane fatty-acyl-phospholipid synthase-like methyltransferase